MYKLSETENTMLLVALSELIAHSDDVIHSRTMEWPQHMKDKAKKQYAQAQALRKQLTTGDLHLEPFS